MSISLMPLTDEEQAAFDWMDAIFARDPSARIGRRRFSQGHTGAPLDPPVWTFSFDVSQSFFLGAADEALRDLILRAYRTAIAQL